MSAQILSAVGKIPSARRVLAILDELPAGTQLVIPAVFVVTDKADCAVHTVRFDVRAHLGVPCHAVRHADSLEIQIDRVDSKLRQTFCMREPAEVSYSDPRGEEKCAAESLLEEDALQPVRELLEAGGRGPVEAAREAAEALNLALFDAISAHNNWVADRARERERERRAREDRARGPLPGRPGRPAGPEK